MPWGMAPRPRPFPTLALLLAGMFATTALAAGSRTGGLYVICHPGACSYTSSRPGNGAVLVIKL
jgi:hypothetical protein